MKAAIVRLTVGGYPETFLHQEDDTMEQNDESLSPAVGGSPSIGSIHPAGRPSFWWSFSAACILCAAAAYFQSPQKLITRADLVPYLLGHSVGGAIVIFGLFYFIFWRKHYAQYIGKAFLMLAAVSIAVTFAGYHIQTRSEAAKLAEIKSNLDSALQSGSPENAASSLSKMAQDLAGEKGKLTNDLFLFMQEKQKIFEQRLAENGLNTLLTPSRIAQDTDFSQSKAILGKMNAAFLDYRKDVLTKYNETLREAVDAAAQSPGDTVLAAAARGLQGGKNGVVKMLAVEQDVLFRANDIILFLERTKGTWKISGNTLIFDKNETLQEYTKAQSALFNTIEEEKKFASQSAENLLKSLK